MDYASSENFSKPSIAMVKMQENKTELIILHSIIHKMAPISFCLFCIIFINAKIKKGGMGSSVLEPILDETQQPTNLKIRCITLFSVKEVSHGIIFIRKF
jgi:hypothetical protein